MGCPQGLHDFLRSYYHFKSADWPGAPSPERAAAERRHQALPQHGSGRPPWISRHIEPLTGATCRAFRFPGASDYHSEWVFGNYFAVV